jgi:GAF domain-containing protein
MKIFRKDVCKDLKLRLTAQQQEIAAAITCIEAIKNMEFNSSMPEFIAFSTSQLVANLMTLNEKIVEYNLKENSRTWVAASSNEVVTLLQQNRKTVEELCDSLLRVLIRRAGANQGGLFLHQQKDQHEVLHMAACFAYGRKKHHDVEIPVGHGVLGQAFLEGGITELSEVPTNYVKITSGLGEALPRFVTVIVLEAEDKKVGVLEIAFFTKPEEKIIEFLKSVTESIARAIIRIKETKANEILLREAQEAGQNLKSQEEELRQNLEELQAIQEDMRNKNRVLEESKVEVDKRNREIESLNRLTESKLETQKSIYELQIEKLTKKLKSKQEMISDAQQEMKISA